MMTLPPFPVTGEALDAIEHALGASLTVEDGEHVLVGAEYSLSKLLDFYAGVDPTHETLITEHGPMGLPVYESHDLHYHHNDVIRSLIDEVRRLRAELRTLTAGRPPIT